VVDEDVVRLVDAVVVLVLVDRDPADRVELAGGVRRLHVAADLEDEHAPVAVERDLRGLLDVGIGEHGLHPEAGGQPEALGFLRGRQDGDGQLLGEIGFPHRRAAASGSRARLSRLGRTTRSGGLCARLAGRRRFCLCLRDTGQRDGQ
jgi:hypothetical protein